MRFENESAYYWCKEIESSVMTIQDTLQNEDLPYFMTGKLLGTFNSILDSSKNTISNDLIHALIGVIKKLNLSNEVFNEISELAVEMTKDSPSISLHSKKVNAPLRIYGLISNYICM